MIQAAFGKLGFLLVALLWSSAILAQGQSDDTRCLRKIDSYYIYFTAFQPSPASMGKKFCQDIPTLGKVITTIDYADPALGDMKTEVRVIEVESWDAALDEAKDAQAKTVLQIPAKTYPQDTVTVEYVFDQPGYFVEILTLEGAGQTRHVLRFPFQVGVGGGAGRIAAMAAIALALGLGVYFVVQRRSAYRLAEAEKERMVKEAEERVLAERKKAEEEQKQLAEEQKKQEEEKRRKEAEERALAEKRKAEEEKRRLEEDKKLNAADATCSQAEKTLAELSDKLTEEMRKRLESALRETREAVARGDAQAASERAKALEEMLKEADAAISAQTPEPDVGPSEAPPGGSESRDREPGAEKEK